MPDDSLFESSKASTGYQTALINKRQFQGRNGPGGKNTSIMLGHKKTDSAGPAALQSFRAQQSKPMGVGVKGKGNTKKLKPDSMQAEGSFAA